VNRSFELEQTKKTGWFCAGLIILGLTAAQATVSIESLLNEMIDRDGVARFQEQNFRIKQHGSYNRLWDDTESNC
jgi:hypothetical protein